MVDGDAALNDGSIRYLEWQSTTNSDSQLLSHGHHKFA